MCVAAFQLYYYDQGSLSSDAKSILKATLQHMPQATGYYTHWVSHYEVTGKHSGYGMRLRKPDEVKEYTAATGYARALNRIRHDGESIFGRGAIGYKGLFEPHGDEKVYHPDRQLVRTELQNVCMRRPPTSI